MNGYKLQILETLVLLVLYLLAFFIIKNLINNVLKNIQLQRDRRKIIIKGVHLFTTIGVIIVLAGIWGLEQNKIAVFVSTVLTALGIAFFAQWSLLSNITSSIILFFNHPMKLGDTIKILDKDSPIEGEVTELSYFFVQLKTKEGEVATIPNSILLQKTIMINPN
ncbi:MAG: mechanosensitive ion channel domain-containing protein [Chitinophagales bacterium]|jgi:small-conductance mechanosensitive channel